MGTPTEIVFRKMIPADVDAVNKLDEKCFGGDAWSLAFLISEVKNPHCKYLVGEVDGKIIACAGIEIFSDEAEMTTFAVAPEFQGRGLGKRLLEETICLAKKFGATSMIFEVRCSNIPALHVYQKFGFRKIGRIKNYYYDSEDALTMGGEI
ncbi:MAG: ribosomal protein S18-alanine N-acetyltransferase [Selenomonadaceae bacterium]|nr:ribosomal protein S18-alanine N-acetyltransferase [Selenomonadaceae bacterium]